MTEPHSIAQRRLLISASGLCMAGLVAGAFVLSYDDLRKLALMGGAHARYAALYPAMVDGLVVMTILSLLLARRARDAGAGSVHRSGGGPHAPRGRHRIRGSGPYWWSRFLRWSLLILLAAGAGALAVQRSVRGYQRLPHAWVSAGVAAAPWVILLIAAWLWLTMVTQARAARPALDVDGAIVPGLSQPTPEPTRPEPLALEPGTPEQPAPEPEPDDPEEPEEPAWMRRPPPPPDVKLVGRKVPLGDTDPDGIPTVDQEPEDVEDDRFADDRAEDPDGGDGAAIIFEHRSDTPPSSTFRSSPIPPGNEDTGENLLATGPNGEG